MGSGSDAFFIGLFIFAIASDIAAWWKFGKTRPSLTSRQEMNTLVGLLANSVAFAFPFAYAFSSIFTLSLQRALAWQYVLIGCWVLCALTLAVSFFALKQVRLPLIFGSLATGVFWAMVPVGVL